MSEETTCEVCQGSGWSGHPDSGDMCYKCKGAGGYAAANDDGIALALYMELAAYFDPKLTEHDKRIVLDKIKYRSSNTLIEEQAARIAELQAELEREKKETERLDGAWHALHERMVKDNEGHARYFEKSQARIHELFDAEAASQARLSEAVKVIEEMRKWLDYLPSEYPDDAEMVMVLSAKAKAFIATLGENKN